MSKLKKIGALSVASIMAISLAGCTDMSKIMTVDDVEVNAGIYINYMLTEYSEHVYSLNYSGVKSDYMNQEIEDHDGKKVKLKDFLPDYAYEQTLDLVAINKQFEKLGLELSKEDSKEVSEAVNNYMESMTEEYLEKQGVSKDSVNKYFTAEKQKEVMFHYYYGEDGDKAVKNDDIKKYLKDSYLRYKVISVPRTTEATTTASTSEGETATTQSAEEQTKASKKADKKAKALAEKYLKIAKENKDFDKVISQYNSEIQETTAQTSTEATTASTTVSESNTNTSNMSSTSSTDTVKQTTTTAVTENKEVHVHFYDQNGEEYGEDTPQKAQTIKSGEKAKEPEAPKRDFYTFDKWSSDAEGTSEFDFNQEISNDTSIYASFTTNEVMVSMADTETVDDLQKYINEKIKKFDEPQLYKDDNNYYIIVKYDPTKRTDYLIDGDYYETILTEMKYDEYDSLIKGWEKDFKITKNEKAFKKYTPSKMEEIEKEYTEEHSQNSNA